MNESGGHGDVKCGKRWKINITLCTIRKYTKLHCIPRLLNLCLDGVDNTTLNRGKMGRKLCYEIWISSYRWTHWIAWSNRNWNSNSVIIAPSSCFYWLTLFLFPELQLRSSSTDRHDTTHNHCLHPTKNMIFSERLSILLLYLFSRECVARVFVEMALVISLRWVWVNAPHKCNNNNIHYCCRCCWSLRIFGTTWALAWAGHIHSSY